MNELSLFSGYGGFSLGLRLAGLKVRTISYVEIELYCQEVIKARIKDGYLDDAPIWDDIRTFRGEQFRGLVDIITGGFPCQPHSHAGKRKGKDDERNLWPDTLRIIREVEPRYVLLENVRGLADGDDPYSAEILGQLSEAGYDCRWGLLSAAQVGAPHKRERWWCLAYSSGVRFDTWGSEQSLSWVRVDGETRKVADANSEGLAQRESQSSNNDSQQQTTVRTSGWIIESDVDRVVNGTPYRVDRLKALGGGIVPEVAAEFLRLIQGE